MGTSRPRNISEAKYSHGKNKKNKSPSNTEPRVRLPHLDLLSIVFLCLVGVLLYYPTMDDPFHYDDFSNIVENVYIKNIKNIPLFIEGLRIHNRWFRALPSFTFALNYHFNRLDVFGYHLINLLLHLGSGILVYLISKHLLNREMSRKETPAGDISRYRIPLLSLFVALVFIVHPLQVNTAAYIVQRNEGMCAFFFLLSLFLFMKGMAAAGWSRIFLLSGVVITSFGAAFSKETGFVLPVVLILYDLMFVCRNRGDMLTRLKIYGAPLLAILLYVLFLFHGGILRLLIKGHGTWFWSPYENLLTQANVIIQYLKLLLLPWPGWLNIDHDFSVSRSLLRAPTFFSVSVLLFLLFLSLFLVKRKRLVSFSILWFFIILAPSSSLIPLWDIMVEYRLYLPMVAYGLILALGIDYLHRLLILHGSRRLSRGISIGVMILFLSVYTVFAVQRERAFADGVTLWEDAVRKEPPKARAYLNLGVMLFRSGRLEEAKRMLEQALAMRPKNNPLGHYNLGVVYNDLGNYEKAVAHLEEYLKGNSRDAQANNEMGTVYLRMGSLDKAVSYFKRALETSPGFAPAHAGLADTFLRKEMIDEAVSEYKKALSLDPDLSKARIRLAEAYFKKGMAREAQFELKQAMSLVPEPDTYASLGVVYLYQDKLDQAIELLRKAEALNPNDPGIYSNLGVSYRKKGKIDEAILQYRKALEIDPDLLDAHVNLGEAYRVKKMTEEALAEYRKAISLSPLRPEPYNHLGVLCLEKKEIDEAIAQFKKAVSLRPGYGEAYSNLAVAYYYKKDYEKAWEASQKAQSLGYEVNPRLVEILRARRSQRHP